jgi:hypothetical protein
MVDTDRLISLVRTISADPALLDRLAATPPADRGSVLAEIGFGDVSPADLVGSETLLAPSSVEEIDDEQLASVAGGGGGDTWGTDTTTGITSMACAVAAT